MRIEGRLGVRALLFNLFRLADTNMSFSSSHTNSSLTNYEIITYKFIRHPMRITKPSRTNSIDLKIYQSWIDSDR